MLRKFYGAFLVFTAVMGTLSTLGRDMRVLVTASNGTWFDAGFSKADALFYVVVALFAYWWLATEGWRTWRGDK